MKNLKVIMMKRRIYLLFIYLARNVVFIPRCIVKAVQDVIPSKMFGYDCLMVYIIISQDWFNDKLDIPLVQLPPFFTLTIHLHWKKISRNWNLFYRNYLNDYLWIISIIFYNINTGYPIERYVGWSERSYSYSMIFNIRRVSAFNKLV